MALLNSIAFYVAQKPYEALYGMGHGMVGLPLLGFKGEFPFPKK